MAKPDKMNVQQQTLVKRVSENYMILTDKIRKKDPQVAAAYGEFSRLMKALQKTTEELYKKKPGGKCSAHDKGNGGLIVSPV